MTIAEYTSVNNPTVKTVSAVLAAVGADAWAEAASIAATVASVLAALYTVCLMAEFIWCKWLRPLLERRGVIDRIRRRRGDAPKRRRITGGDIDA